MLVAAERFNVICLHNGLSQVHTGLAVPHTHPGTWLSGHVTPYTQKVNQPHSAVTKEKMEDACVWSHLDESSTGTKTDSPEFQK